MSNQLNRFGRNAPQQHLHGNLAGRAIVDELKTLRLRASVTPMLLQSQPYWYMAPSIHVHWLQHALIPKSELNLTNRTLATVTIPAKCEDHLDDYGSLFRTLYDVDSPYYNAVEFQIFDAAIEMYLLWPRFQKH